MNKQPKLSKLIMTDFALFLTVIGTMFSLTFSAYAYFKLDDVTLSIVMIGIAIFVAIIFFYRVLYLKQLFETGITETGLIQDVIFYRDRGRVDFTYDHAGITYKASNAIMKNKKTKLLSNEMPVTVIINKNNSKKAIISDLYF